MADLCVCVYIAVMSLTLYMLDTKYILSTFDQVSPKWSRTNNNQGTQLRIAVFFKLDYDINYLSRLALIIAYENTVKLNYFHPQ